MVQINFALREVNVKIVYYGPGRSGKTTNLETIHAKAPKGSIGEMMSIATETDRTLFFDFLPLDLGKVAGMNTKFQLYTVPGQVYYKATRKLVLQGADGVVFVADSQADMMEENQQSLADLEENLRENGLDINEIPLVLQWNKRDLENILPAEELNSKLNRWNAPHFEAVAIRGDGVFPSLKSLASVVIKKLNQEHGYGAEADSAPPPAPAPTTTVKTKRSRIDTTSAAKEVAADLVGSATPTDESAPAPAAAPPPPPPPPTAQGSKPSVTEDDASAAPPPPPPPPPAVEETAKPAASETAPPPPAPADQKPQPTTEPPKAAVPTPAPPPPQKPVEEKAPAAKKPKPQPATAAKAAAPEKAAPITGGASSDAQLDTEDLNPVSREIRRRREAREKQRQQEIERIRAGSKKPLKKKGGISPVYFVVGGVIAVAAAVIAYAIMQLT